MKTLRIKNIRSIEDSGDIELKPITAIIGKNSCGKSSFIRTIPLIKQSLEKPISESLLWYGDYVDFGNFKNVKSNFAPDKDVEIDFSLNIQHFLIMDITDLNLSKTNMEFKVKMVLDENIIKNYSIEYYDQIIYIELSEEQIVKKISINNKNNLIDCNKYIWIRDPLTLLPIIYEKDNNIKGNNILFYRYMQKENNVIKKIIDIIYEKSNKKLTDNELKKYIISIDSQKNILKKLKTKNNPIREYFSNITIQDDFFKELNFYIALYCLPRIIENINYQLSSEMEQTYYIKPIRANVNRYYRVQGVNIDHIDADGSNLPMILYNLEKDKLKQFEKWTKEKFGVEFSISKETLPVSLLVREDDSTDFTNLADAGYGYSQILPVIVQLWLQNLNENDYFINRKFNSTIIIEQPELHLHPAFQAKIIDVFVNVIKEAQENNIELKIIFETHSSIIINRLGYLVSNNKIPNSLINILFFEKKDKITTITSRQFNEIGLIKDWPIGFFSPEG